ncbi:MAG: DMT family transporter [Acidobacteria bacterium]|nr:DMT family transporter [Acidobacteriota bacterium]
MTAHGRRFQLVRRGPLLMLAASLAFVTMTALVKIVRADLGGFEVVMWRGVISAPLLLLLARGQRLEIRNRRAFAWRLFFGFSGMVGYAVAARGLSLVDLNLIGKLRPVIIAIAAPLVLGRGERAGSGEWGILAIGFAGCALLIGPNLAVGSLYGLWALFSVVFSAGSHIALRRLGASDSARVIVLWFHVGVAVLAALGILITRGAFRLPPSSLWPALVGIAMTATAAQLMMTRAYALDKATVVAAASYAGPVWSLIGDLLIFGLVPTRWAIAGGALVIGSSLWLVIRREEPATPSAV